MKLSILTLSFFVFAFTATGAEKIEGAFGLKLGDVFEPKTAAVQGYGFDAYELEPEQRNSSFSKYFVFITPQTHRIFQIMAIGQAPDVETAAKRSKALGAFLNGKYGEGPTFLQRLPGSVNQSSIVQGENRQILLSVIEHGPQKEFRVSYQDGALMREAVQEKQASELKSLLGELDSTGL